MEHNQKASRRLLHVQGDEQKECQNYGLSSLGDAQSVDALLGAHVSVIASYPVFI